MSETRSEEFARLVHEYQFAETQIRQEAWNLIADFAFENAHFIRDAMAFYAKGDDLVAEVTAARETAAELTHLRSLNAELVAKLEQHEIARQAAEELSAELLDGFEASEEYRALGYELDDCLEEERAELQRDIRKARKRIDKVRVLLARANGGGNGK